MELNDEFHSILKSQLDKMQKEKEFEELKKLQKTTNVFYTNVPPQTKLSALTALKCPSCQAPLEYMPPCKCEHWEDTDIGNTESISLGKENKL